ncbi:MAG: hypothetical protein ACI9LU_000229 [Polaribacter sp.]
MDNIIDDLRGDDLQLTEGINTAVINTQAANFVLKAAGRPQADNITFLVDSSQNIANTLIAPASRDLDPKLTNMHWQLSVARYHPTQSASALGSLIAGGNLNLLRDKELIKQLQVYQDLWRGLEDSQDLTYRPFRNQTAFVGQKFGLSLFSNVPKEELIGLVRDNPELEGTLRALAEYSIIHHAEMVQTLKVTRELLVDLGKTSS